jgi:tetratricopeptide (TPR) repeat protein
VKQLNAGSRATEAQARLLTIYQKLAVKLASSGKSTDSEQALDYLNKVNALTQNPQNFEMASDLCAKSGKLDQAIDNLKKAIQLGDRSPSINRKLAALLDRRGKELAAQGKSESAKSYFDQAKDLNPKSAPLVVALSNLSVQIDNSQVPTISGDVMNPSDHPVSAPNVKIDLFDKTNGKVLWTKDRVVPELAQLNAQESKPFVATAGAPLRSGATIEFRVYFDGTLNKELPISFGDQATGTENAGAADAPKSEKAEVPDRHAKSEPQPEPTQSKKRGLADDEKTAQ